MTGGAQELDQNSWLCLLDQLGSHDFLSPSLPLVEGKASESRSKSLFFLLRKWLIIPIVAQFIYHHACVYVYVCVVDGCQKITSDVVPQVPLTTWPGSPKDLPVSISPTLGLQVHTLPCLIFWWSNLGPHTCKVKHLPTNLSPQPYISHSFSKY